jgi:glucan phosphoethanolaminetransferase (alkaline phosphatase superfamily)
MRNALAIGEQGTPQTRRFSLYLLVAMYLAPAIAMAIWSWQAYRARSLATLLLATVLEGVLLAACTRTWRIFFLVHFPVFILTLAFTIYTLGFGILPGQGLALLLVTTSWEEVSGLLGISQQRWLILPLMALLAAYLALAWRLPRLPIFSGKALVAARILLALSVPVAAFTAQDSAELIDGIALNPTLGTLLFIGGRVPEALGAAAGARVTKVPYHARRVGEGEEVHILIVGESARRASWSAYGYQRPTTPYLDKLQHEAIFLQNMQADANMTLWAVPMLLTGLSPAQITTVSITGNLFDLAKEAGYSTAWLVNQDIAISRIIGIKPDRLEYPKEAKAALFGSRLLDGVLLPAYRRELARGGTARFIGMHITESHWDYNRRYPPEFQRFGVAAQLASISLFKPEPDLAAKLRDAYDNSVLYTDWFLQQVVEGARGLQVPATVTFVADHGESLAALDVGYTGHGGTDYQHAQFDIPAFIWVNEAYRQRHPQTVAALEHNSRKEIRSHDVFYTMADLMGITWPGAREERSFASDRFVPDTTAQFLAGGVLVTPP